MLDDPIPLHSRQSETRAHKLWSPGSFRRFYEYFFIIDDLRILTYFVGCGVGGPEDSVLGERMLGSIQHADSHWRWSFNDIGTDVHGDFHDTEAAAMDDLVNVQAQLFPAGWPTVE